MYQHFEFSTKHVEFEISIQTVFNQRVFDSKPFQLFLRLGVNTQHPNASD